MRTWLRRSLYTGAALVIFGAGWASSSYHNAPDTSDFDYKGYKPKTNFEVIFQYYDEGKKEWVDDRRGLVDKFSISEMTAEGVNNRGQKCRGFVKYNTSRSHDLASK